MKNAKAAGIYAKTLLKASMDENNSAKVYDDMTLIADVFNQTPGLRRFLENPVLNSEKKSEVLLFSFASKVSPLTEKFFTLLAKRDRLSILESAAEQFIILEESRRNVLKAQVTSASALTAEQLARIEAMLRKLEPGKTFQIQHSIDPNLLGGFSVSMGDTIIDTSLRRKLNNLRRKLAA